MTTGLDSKAILLASEKEIWRWDQVESELEIAYYLTNILPDLNHITSVRGIVLREQEVLMLTNADGVQHVTPGGRIEVGETLLGALAREITEETGWHFVHPQLLGVVCYHHLTPCPDAYPYPYPEFLQVVYSVQAEKYSDVGRQENDYEKEARFLTILEALKLPIASGQKAYLRNLRSG